MAETELDSFPVSQLQDRYGIVRSAVYARLEGLKIKPEKQGTKSFINAAQLRQMDELNKHIKEGGTLPSFLSSGQLAESSGQSGRTSIDTQDKSSGRVVQSSGQSGQEVFMLMFERLAERLVPVANPLSNLEALERAAEKGWLLSTSQLAPLIGLKSDSFIRKKQFERYGFKIAKAGRNGTESAWKISK